ncbi:MAG: biotin--[acetyl-CoA-carboxylase] ligase [Methylobacteriaceae bacterium]|nr:biotin--[acetyl-CoA-carboxylase] ligase [Methylobacteriaceae bacterium]
MALELDADAKARGFRLAAIESIGSTNDEGLDRAAVGDAGRLWIVAKTQTGGRGRRGRRWLSPPGNLYATLLLIDAGPVARLAELGFVAGVAIASTLRDLGLASDRFAIKWPNDLLAGRAKFAGILLEARQMPARAHATVVGIGVNCAWHPDDLAYPATDLAALMGHAVTPGDVFAPLSHRMAGMLDLWDRGDGFARIREIWLDFAAGVGEVIRVDAGTRSYEGVFETLDPRGRLLLGTKSGTIAIEAGDILLARPEGSREGALT